MLKLFLVLILGLAISNCRKSTEGNDYYSVTALVLDYDSKLPVQGAKVYTGHYPIIFSIALDSAITDVSGKVNFTYHREQGIKLLSTIKTGMIWPDITVQAVPGYPDRIDTLYLAKPSFVDINIHRSGVYFSGDIINVTVNHNSWLISHIENIYLHEANSPDTLIHLPTYYHNPYATKLYIKWEVTRNGTVISSNSDSTNKIQYGIQNYSLNY